MVLFVNGHHSHFSFSLVKLAKEKQVELICNGIYPFNMSAIPWKFSLSLPFGDSTPTISCNETPLRGELKTLRPKEGNKPQKRRHVKGHYGEALTSDEVYEKLAEEERQKEAEKKETATIKKEKKAKATYKST